MKEALMVLVLFLVGGILGALNVSPFSSDLQDISGQLDQIAILLAGLL